MSTERGISIIEIIFSVGVIGMVVVGLISLLVRSTSVKTVALQRKEASEVAEMVVEDLVYMKNSDPAFFWKNNLENPPKDSVGRYSYSVGYTQITEGACSSTQIDCINAVINISWGDSQTMVIQRFFSK